MIAVLLAIVAFGFIHSILASKEAKSAFEEKFGERAYHGLYRLTYNIITIMTLLPVGALMISQSNRIVWHVESPISILFLILQGIGVIGLLISVLQIDGGQFLGTSQAIAYFTGKKLPLPKEPLSVKGVYAFVRHPLYLFSLMVIWFVPTMSEGYLGFCIGATLYFIIGSWYEEKRLIAYFGDEYRAYQKRVAWMIPFVIVKRG
ncbi:MAG TPA: NnrU family protein [Aggregatilineales bacterium]|nr:NnrU family protein [Aggregatilineales bacterium]